MKAGITVKKSRLEGEVHLSGAKNSGLKLLTASVLTGEKVEILNSPNELLDMQVHISMLRKMGKKCTVSGSSISIEESDGLQNELIWDRSIRN